MKATFTTTIEIDSDRVRDLLVTAFEGGSNYWCEDDLARGKTPDTPDATQYDCWYAVYPTTGGSVTFSDREEPYVGSANDPHVSVDLAGRYVLDTAAIQRGFRTMSELHPARLAQWMVEDYDADDADAFLQCCIFGSVIYG
jgi:hypothetical protein